MGIETKVIYLKFILVSPLVNFYLYRNAEFTFMDIITDIIDTDKKDSDKP